MEIRTRGTYAVICSKKSCMSADHPGDILVVHRGIICGIPIHVHSPSVTELNWVRCAVCAV